jgi:hypothetical protein
VTFACESLELADDGKMVDLPAVFDIRQKRWVRPERASTEEVMAQVAQCPSGALQIRPPSIGRD